MEHLNTTYHNCRVCNSTCTDFSELVYNYEENYAYKLSAVVPEVDLSLTVRPIICKECARTLEEAYLLRLRCLETETYLYNALQNPTFKSNTQQNVSIENDNNIEPTCKIEIGDCQVTSTNRAGEHVKLEVRENFETDKGTKEFCSKDELVVHKKCDTIKKDTFECPCCEKVFKTKRSLGTHKRAHECEKPFCCDKCAKCFRTRQQLVTHINIHEDKKLFLCCECGKGFSAKGNLIVHVRKHTGEKPFSCPVCDKRFTVKCNMQYHMKYTHNIKCSSVLPNVKNKIVIK